MITKRFARLLSIALTVSLLIQMTVLGFMPVSEVYAADPAGSPTLSLNIKNKLDVALSVGSTTVDVSTFEQDLRTALTAKGVAAEDVNVSAVKASQVSVADNFNWWVYDHYNTNTVGSGTPASAPTNPGYPPNTDNSGNRDTTKPPLANPSYDAPYINHSTHQYAEGYLENNKNFNLNRHIIVEDNGQTMTMNGYGAPAYKDFMYMENTESTKKTFKFKVQELAAFDALDGGGFLFNTTITGDYGTDQKMSGYLVFLEYNTSGKGSAIKLYKFENIDTKAFHNEASKVISAPEFTLLASSTGYLATDTWRNIKIEAYPTKVKMWYKGSVAEDNSVLSDNELINWTISAGGSSPEVTLPAYVAAKSYGFGPMISYRSHSCARPTQFKFKSLTLSTDKVKSLTEVVREPEWRDNAQKFIVNLNEEPIADFSDSQKVAELISRLNNEDINYVGWGKEINKDESNKFLLQNDSRGTFVNIDDSATDTYQKQVDAIADYIVTKYNKEVGNGDADVLTSDNVAFEADVPLVNTIDGTWPQGKWKVVHATTGFDNEKGLFAYNNQPISNLNLTFSKPGKYEIYYEDTLIRTIYAHEKPIALFKATTTTTNGAITVSYEDSSYDPDSRNQADKGITDTQWAYMDVTTGSAIWTSGQLTTVELEKTYLISLKVKDSFGQWSDTYTRQLSTITQATTKPMADFKLATTSLFVGKEVGILDNSYDPSGAAITGHNWSVAKNGTSYSKTVTSSAIDFTGDGPGTYVVSLTVTSASGTSEAVSRTLVIQDPIPAPTNPVQNDSNKTFGWTNVPNYTKAADYVYSLDNGATWITAVANPQTIPNANYAAGVVQVRVKADSDSERLAGAILSSTAEYTQTSPTPAELANEAIAAAKALIPTPFTAVEGTHTNLLTYLNALSGMSETGTTLSIVSSNENVTDDGAISYTGSQVTGNVVVHINKAQGTEDTQSIEVIIPAHMPTVGIDLASDKNALGIGYAALDNADSVKRSLYLTKSGKTGTTITWASSETVVVTSNGRVSRPGPDSEDKMLTLTATLTNPDTSESLTKVFNIRVIKLNDEEAAKEAATALTAEKAFDFEDGDTWESVTKSFLFLTTGLYNTSIAWSSDKPLVIGVSDQGVTTGTVTRGTADSTVLLTATITKGASSVTKTFLMNVKKLGVVQTDTREETGRNAQTESTTVLPGDAPTLPILRTATGDGKTDYVKLDLNSAHTLTDNIDPNAAEAARTVTLTIKKDPLGAPDTVADAYAVEIPGPALGAIAERRAPLEILTDYGHIKLGAEALDTLQQKGTDLYFRIVPIKAGTEQTELKNLAANNSDVKAAAGGNTILLQGEPRKIETNYSGVNTKVVLPFAGITLPLTNREAFVNALRVYVEHSDGSIELKTGTIIYVDGQPFGIEIEITRFSRFQIVQFVTPTDSGGNHGNGGNSNTTGNTSAKPVITLAGNTEITIPINGSYNDAGVTAKDANGVDISSRIVIINSVNPKIPGDYTVTYNVTDSAGNVAHQIVRTVHVTGVGRLAGWNSVDTALEIAKASYAEKVTNVILATSENYPDALVGSVLAYKLKAPILLVGRSNADQEKILAYLKEHMNPTGTVYILGGTAVVSSAMEAKVTASGFKNITRLGGYDRYETAIKIAEYLGVKQGTPIVLAYGENYPDALSVSSAAAVMQSPILLVRKDGMSDAVKKKIAEIKPSKVYIVGLQGVISSDVESQVAQITSLDKANIVRVGGVDRFETSLEVAKYFNLSGKNVCLATGNNFPDALAGSVSAALSNAPIILVDANLSANAKAYLKSRKITGATIFGGEGVLSKGVEQELSSLIGQK